MPAEYVLPPGSVRAACPGCGGALTTYELVTAGGAFTQVVRQALVKYQGILYSTTVYRLLQCAGCGRGGLATILERPSGSACMIDFYPFSREIAPLPPGTPDGVVAEYREAELCAAVQAWRAASALLRSALEKTLIANGYTDGSLHTRIDEAARDGVITPPRQKRAHDDVRVLGNDVLHEEWRVVTAEEYEAAHHYVQRIIEDFYDLRAEVEAMLTKAGRLPLP